MSKKILFITAFFYPQNVIASLRTSEWAKYLAKYGYDVTVLTTKKHPFLYPLGLEKNLPDNVSIVEVEFLPKIVKVFFHREKKHQSKKIKSRYASGKVYTLKNLSKYLRNYIGSFVDIHDLWIKPALNKAEKLFEEQHFDFIISSYSPPAAHIIAHKLKLKYPRTIWIADFRDLWAYNHISSAKGILGVLERRKEKKILSNADKIITVSEHLTEIMKNVYKTKEVHTIENGFDPEEFPNWKKNLIPFPKIDNKLTISYLGTIYPQKRDPSILFEAINELIEENIVDKNQVEINFYGNNEKPLEDIIVPNNYNRYNIINIKGFVSRKESIRIQKDSDLLLFLEWNDPSAKGVLTGKLFEYLVSGTPILAVGVSNKNAAGALIEKTNTGKLFLNKEELKKELTNIFKKKEIGFYNPRIEEIEKFSRDKQVKKLISIMEKG